MTPEFCDYILLTLAINPPSTIVPQIYECVEPFIQFLQKVVVDLMDRPFTSAKGTPCNSHLHFKEQKTTLAQPEHGTGMITLQRHACRASHSQISATHLPSSSECPKIRKISRRLRQEDKNELQNNKLIMINVFLHC